MNDIRPKRESKIEQRKNVVKDGVNTEGESSGKVSANKKKNSKLVIRNAVMRYRRKGEGEKKIRKIKAIAGRARNP